MFFVLVYKYIYVFELLEIEVKVKFSEVILIVFLAYVALTSGILKP